MSEPQAEAEIAVVKEARSVDDALRQLWQKVRDAAEALRQVRTERNSLAVRVRDLERETASLRALLGERDSEVKRLRAEGAAGNPGFSSEEREMLKSRIRDLIAKINSHL